MLSPEPAAGFKLDTRDHKGGRGQGQVAGGEGKGAGGSGQWAEREQEAGGRMLFETTHKLGEK